jgi:glycine hydroxymethyltransferase
MLVDLRAKGLTGKAAEALLGEAHMTCNKNAIPNDPESPWSPAASGWVRRP